MRTSSLPTQEVEGAIENSLSCKAIRALEPSNVGPIDEQAVGGDNTWERVVVIVVKLQRKIPRAVLRLAYTDDRDITL